MTVRESMQAELARRKAVYAEALQSAPSEGITAGELAARSGMTRSWVETFTVRLAEAGTVTRLSRHWFAPVPGRDVASGLAGLLKAA